jgi:DNA-binding CsgD family transcriptional regulator
MSAGLIGRSSELDTIRRMLADVRARRSRVLLLHGDPGIGKSALLAAAAADGADMRVLRCSGAESEASLAFAALQQLVRPIVSRIDRLPDLQARALRSAIGLAEAGGDRFLVGVALISLLADLAEECPVLVLVDDAQWLDQPSADAILFAARRLEVESVAVLIAGQDGLGADLRGRGLVELGLRGLDPSTAADLLDSRVPALVPKVRDRLVEWTGGNPLAMIELGSSLSDDQRKGLVDLPDALPVGAGIHQAFASRVKRLSPQARRCALVVALEYVGDQRAIIGAMRELAIEFGALDEPEASGLIVADDDVIRFAHPMLRSAVIGTSTLAERMATHAALAKVLRGEDVVDRHLWHLAAAARETDDELASSLEAAAARAQLRSGPSAAASMLERAANLSSDAAARGRRFVGSASKALDAGQRDRIEALLRQAEGLPIDDRTRAEAGFLRAAVQFDDQTIGMAIATLLASAQLVQESDPVAAARTRLAAMRMAWFGDDLPQIREIERTVAALDLPPGDLYRDLAIAMSAVQLDPASGFSRIGAAVKAMDGSGDSMQLHAFVPSFIFDLLGQEQPAIDFYQRFVAAERERGAAGRLVWGLVALAWLQAALGDWPGGSISASEARRLGPDIGQPTIAGRSAAILALIAAGRGQAEDCRRLAAEAGTTAEARGLRTTSAAATWALGRLDLGLGEYESAFDRLWTLADDGAWPGRRFIALLATGDAVEASVRAGRADAGAEIINGFETWWLKERPPWAQAVALRSRALLTDGTEALDFARRAAALDGAPLRRFEHARSELLLGSLLRRERHRAEARSHIRAAIETFDRIGAVPWLERANHELRATGESVRSRATSVLADVTPQELQIGRLASQGLTNRQIGATLFLSPRTVGSHLYRLFPKLGISSRAELRLLDLDAVAASPVEAEQSAPPRRLSVAGPDVLRVGVFPFMAESHAVKRLVTLFLDDHPGLRVRVLERWTPEQEALLARKELDIGIVTWPVANGPYHAETLVRQRAEVAINRSDPLSSKFEVEASDLGDRLWMFPSSSTHVALHAATKAWFDQRGVNPQLADLQGWVPSSLSSLQSALRGQRAWTILLPAFGGALDYDIVRRPLRDGPTIEVVVIGSPDGGTTSAADFVAAAKSVARDFVDPGLQPLQRVGVAVQ